MLSLIAINASQTKPAKPSMGEDSQEYLIQLLHKHVHNLALFLSPLVLSVNLQKELNVLIVVL